MLHSWDMIGNGAVNLMNKMQKYCAFVQMHTLMSLTIP